jgi:dTDP-4-amino-4,6-dideoxygalactose transaminase
VIAFVDLRAQYASIRDELEPEIIRAAEEAHYILGDDIPLFESEFADYIGARRCVGVANGTAALHLGFQALGIGPGDEVIAPANTFIASVLPVVNLGAQVVLVDCDEATGQIDVEQVEAAITERTRAVVAVHLYGHPADLDPLVALCDRHGIALVEDACQAHGARYKGRRVGSFGHFAAFSFYPSKNLGALGDGGCVTTNDEELADRIRLLGRLGEQPKNTHVIPAWNERLDTLHAAALRVKLRHLDRWNEQRRVVAGWYDDLLTDVVTPVAEEWAEPVFHLYAVRAHDRDGLREALAVHEIQSGIHYPIPLHLQPALQGRVVNEPGAFPASEARAREQLSLPMFPELPHSDAEKVAAAIAGFAPATR